MKKKGHDCVSMWLSVGISSSVSMCLCRLRAQWRRRDTHLRGVSVSVTSARVPVTSALDCEPLCTFSCTSSARYDKVLASCVLLSDDKFDNEVCCTLSCLVMQYTFQYLNRFTRDISRLWETGLGNIRRSEAELSITRDFVVCLVTKSWPIAFNSVNLVIYQDGNETRLRLSKTTYRDVQDCDRDIFQHVIYKRTAERRSLTTSPLATESMLTMTRHETFLDLFETETRRKHLETEITSLGLMTQMCVHVQDPRFDDIIIMVMT